jgi:hypothetical protein
MYLLNTKTMMVQKLKLERLMIFMLMFLMKILFCLKVDKNIDADIEDCKHVLEGYNCGGKIHESKHLLNSVVQPLQNIMERYSRAFR